MDLIVRSPFDGHAIGTVITDQVKVQEILSDHRSEFVVKFNIPAEPPAEPARGA